MSADNHLEVHFGSTTKVTEKGATFIPDVSEDGTLSWTNDGDLPNPDPVNLMGKDGKDGIDGKDGVDGKDGKDGAPGDKGDPGKDGKSSTIEGSVSLDSWDREDFEKSTYNFKLFGYDEYHNNLNADVSVRFVVSTVSGGNLHDGGFRYTFNLKRPFKKNGNISTRLQFVPQRIIFEDESTKSDVVYFRAYEKSGETDKRELWVEINTDSGLYVSELWFSALQHSGDIFYTAVEPKPEQHFKASSGYDSLTVYTDEWGNKNAVLSLDSRATAEGATVGGTDNLVGAKNAAAFGEGGNVYSTAVRSLQGGTGNKLGYDKKNNKYAGGNDGLQVGYKNTDSGARTLQGGESNENTSTNGIQGGAGNKLHAKNSTLNGSSSTIEGKGYSFFQGYSGYISGEASGGIGEYIRIIHAQAMAFGRYLATGRDYQARFGVGAERDADGNAKDKTSMFVVSNGSAGGGAGRDVFAVSDQVDGNANDGFYAKAIKPNDAITLGYFINVLKTQLKEEILAEIGAGDNPGDDPGDDPGEGGPVKGDLIALVSYDGAELSFVDAGLESGKQYFIEDTLFTAVLNDNDIPCTPYGTSFIGPEDSEAYVTGESRGGGVTMNRGTPEGYWGSSVYDIRIYEAVEGTKGTLFAVFAYNGYLDTPNWRSHCAPNLTDGAQYYIEDTLFTAAYSPMEDYVAPPVGITFTGEDGNKYKVVAHTGPGPEISRVDGSDLSGRIQIRFYSA